MIEANPRPAPEPSPLAAGLLALVVMLQFCAASWLWLLMSTTWLVNRGDYKSGWANSGFRGLPIEELAAGLNRRLPLETPVSTSDAVEAQSMWAQRVKEGLYPRRVEPGAKLVLDLQRGGPWPVIAQSAQGPFVLNGTLPPPPKAPVSGKVDFGFSWGRVVLKALAAFGWGAALALALARRRRSQGTSLPLLAGAGLCGPLFYGLLGTAATMLQRPLPWTVLDVIGRLLAVAVLVRMVLMPLVKERNFRPLFAWVRHPETWVVVLFGASLLRHMSLWPIVGWDGRSIWLYRAKQVAYNGFLTAADAVNPLNFFSHMEYPLLFPTWLAHFGAPWPLREREVAVGIMLMQLGMVACCWCLARRRLGRWAGAAFTGALFVVSVGMAERGYADGFVTLFLLIGMFGLEDSDLEPFGWLALMGASLTKREGFVIATATAALFMLFHPRFRARRWLPRFAPALVMLPALAHAAWTHAVGIKDSYTGTKLPTTLAMASDRFELIMSGVVKIARESNPMAHLTAAIAAYLVLESLGRRSWLSRMMAATAAVVIVFGFVTMMLTPYDVNWHVSTAMERVLLHGIFALIAAVLVALTTREPIPSRRPGATSDP